LTAFWEKSGSTHVQIKEDVPKERAHMIREQEKPEEVNAEAFHYVVVQFKSLASMGWCARIRYANIFRLTSTAKQKRRNRNIILRDPAPHSQLFPSPRTLAVLVAALSADAVIECHMLLGPVNWLA
jgi:hypothetical protein